MQREPVNDHFQTGVVHRYRKVKIAQHQIGGNPSSSLAAHTRCGTLNGESASSQNPCLRTRCTMLARGVKKTATSACARGRGKWETQAPEQENPEELGFNPHQGTGGHH